MSEIQRLHYECVVRLYEDRMRFVRNIISITLIVGLTLGWLVGPMVDELLAHISFLR